MFNLIGNENTKIYRRARTWILLGIILLGIALIAWVSYSKQPAANANWKQNLVTQDVSIQKSLDQSGTHMPEGVRKAQEQALQVNQYYIMHNINPSQHTAWSFAQTAENLAGLLIAFIIVVAGDIVASEFAGGTIKMLLTQTETRSRILLSKYVATLLYALFMTISMFALSLIVGGSFFGFSGMNAPHIYLNGQGIIAYMGAGANLLMTYGFLFIQIIMTVTIAFMISTIFRSSALAITISILAFFVGSTLVTALSGYTWVKYILFANTNLQQYAQGGPIIKGMTLGFSSTMLILYFVVMLVLSWAIFAKRDVAFT